MDEPPNSDNTIIIGNKAELIHDTTTGNWIPTEPYLRVILNLLGNREYIYIKVVPHPEKLAKISEILEVLKRWGVRELVGDRKFIFEEGWKTKAKVKVLLIKWHVIPRLLEYRETLNREIREEKDES